MTVTLIRATLLRISRNKLFLLAALVSGLFVSAAFPGKSIPNLGLGIVMPFAFVPLFVAIRKLAHASLQNNGGPNKIRPFKFAVKAFAITWFFGFVVAACSFFWITYPAILFGGVSPILTYLGFALYCVLSGLYFSTVLAPFIIDCILSVFWCRTLSVFVYAAAATLLEIILPRFFQWTFGSLMHSIEAINQWSAGFGFSVGTLLIFASNLFLTRVFLDSKSLKTFGKGLAVWSAAVVAVVGIGRLRVREFSTRLESAEKVRVGYIQPNFTFAELASNPLRSAEAQTQSLETLFEMSSLVYKQSGDSLDLIVWPESVVPSEFMFSGVQKAKVTDFARSIGVPILLQATDVRRESGKRVTYSISTVASPSGEFGQSYQKWIPMPFGESVPLERVFPWFGELVRSSVGNVSKVGVGTSFEALPFGKWAAGALICFDAIYPELPRLQAAEGKADFFVNQANFVWMGESNAGIEFKEIARFRAIENARSLILVSNTGPTVAYDPLGRELFSPTGLLAQATGVVELPINRETTLYSRYSAYPLLALGFLSWALIAYVVVKCKQSKKDILN